MKILITGGAGFIGSNLAEYYLRRGDRVRILDNLSRHGTPANLEYIQGLGGDFEFIRGDIRNRETCMTAVSGVDTIFHLGAQVAVTTSVVDPVHDFEVNLVGTVNILEAARRNHPKPMIVYTSTNKVYGKMDHIEIGLNNNRWEYANLPTGNPETTPLDFYSPYGCSKGGADQYVHDYCRIYGLDSCVFRMSCIYGPRQMGCEDQGWVAFFLIQAEMGRSVTIYGDGKQIRDVLYVEDLVRAFDAAYRNRSTTRGNVYNIGGGPERTVSLLEFIDYIHNDLSLPLPFSFDAWRPGDQKVYVSDIRRAGRDFNWKPEYTPQRGFRDLHAWIHAHRHLFV
ncbi:GDP-mannose 4,6-dehydratase [bacterium]|nr:GDP-mannose 4,6-dehydratase [candidate division CSSED10-310 bacterium]